LFISSNFVLVKVGFFIGFLVGVLWGVLLRGFLWEWMGIGIMARKEGNVILKNQNLYFPK